ncbi:hypothetical protein NY78_3772 [Desulfovibrio sp. TomC]|nr:hypothetical protein NY78_3772 [Desulfovibrio sp. TomC]
MLLIACLLVATQAAAQDTCKLYTIDFAQGAPDISYAVTAKGNTIGKVVPFKGEGPKPRQITVCIEPKAAVFFEKNAFAYVFNGSIAILTLWPSATKLQENASIKGFTSLLDALAYAAQTIPQIVEETLRELLVKVLNAVFGTPAGTQANPAHPV